MALTLHTSLSLTSCSLHHSDNNYNSSCKTTSQNHLFPKPLLSQPLLQQITDLCSNSSLDPALQLLRSTGGAADLHSLAAAARVLLQECVRRESIDVGRQVHALISSYPQLMSDPVITTRLLTMYAACGSPADSRRVFDSLGDKNIFQYNAMISALARNELWDEAVDLFYGMLVERDDLFPDNFSLPCVFKSCAGLLDVNLGEVTHGMAIKLGLISDTFVSNSLISMYAKCGRVDFAADLFHKMPERNLVSWNTMISGLLESGHFEECFGLFRDMMFVCRDIDDATFVILLPACAREGRIDIGRVLHGLTVKLRLCDEPRVNNSLIDMYAKCGLLTKAELLFLKCISTNVVSWNTIIGGFSNHGDFEGAFKLLRKMAMDGIEANEITILNVLPACQGPVELICVKQIHAFVIRHQLQGNDLVRHSLISAYAKCGSLESSNNVFLGIGTRSVSAWNAVIGGFAQNGDPGKAVELFIAMMDSGMQPDWFSVGSLILACTNLKDVRHGTSVHGYALRKGLVRDPFIGISILSFYVHCGKASKARFIFDAMYDRDQISWNAMISGYSQNEMADECLDLFRQMQQYGHQPSSIATMSALTACSQLSALRLGKGLHCYALKANFTEDTFISCSIIDMYAKCGSIENALDFFNRLGKKDVVSWTAMVTGCAIHGYGLEGIQLFNQMQREGFEPDDCTYLGILMACGHAGLVEEGLSFFEEMRSNNGVQPRLEHYACVADMLGRAGMLEDAVKFINQMPEEPDGKMLSALISACRTHGNIGLGEKVAKKLLTQEPDKAEHYVQISNMFAKSSRWEDVRRVRKNMKENGLQKDPGWSWVEFGGKVIKFIANDSDYVESGAVRTMWVKLEEKIKAMGYIPDTSSVLHELEEEEKVELLRGHSEKQAISFALLSTKRSTKIRVFKNIRMCRDCHDAIKLVTKVVQREIIVRDNKRFHHFRDGRCSCRDYW